MSNIDDVLRANQDYSARSPLINLDASPARKLAVVACMDARLDVARALGLNLGDAHVIRNAGGIVTEDVLRSLILSQQLLGTREVMIVNHTDCGMLKFQDEDLRARLRKSTGTDALIPAAFHAFSNLERNVREQIAAVKSHPWIANDVVVRGFIYDVNLGVLREISAAETRHSAA